MANPKILYRAEPPNSRIVEPLDMMTLIYQRRSGATHLVAEPVPQILEAMGTETLNSEMLAQRLADGFDLGEPETAALLIAERLEELAQLGLVEAISGA